MYMSGYDKFSIIIRQVIRVTALLSRGDIASGQCKYDERIMELVVFFSYNVLIRCLWNTITLVHNLRINVDTKSVVPSTSK